MLPPALLWIILLEFTAPFVVVDEVNVTAAVQPTRGLETPAAVSVVTAETLRLAPGLGLDDTLRHTPGFSLFRRTSSRTANPTTQGVTLRGLSASGASRSLVLVDGVPVNDAFGGWVAWARVPQAAIDRVEVVRGPMTDLYGADAAGGVVQIVTSTPERTSVRGAIETGTLGTRRGSFMAGTARNRLQGWASGEMLTTDGAIPLEPASRGAVDTPAGVTSQSVALGVVRAVGRGGRVGARVRGFFEDRTNGTPLQANDTDSRLISGEAGSGLGAGRWQARGWYGTQGYDQSFSAVASGRATETLTGRQRVPTTVGGGGADWSGAIGRVALVTGGDLRRVEGEAVETRFVQGSALPPVGAGGVQRLVGAFAQARIDPSPAWSFVAGTRIDHWLSDDLDGRARSREVFVNPRVSASWRVSPAVAVHTTVARAFRAPTLNELWRGFRVGNVQTLPNDALLPERLTSGEAAVHVATSRTSLRVTAFLSRLDDAITNVTRSTTSSLVTRQRLNAARVDAAGVEGEADWRFGRFHATGSLAVTSSTFARAREPGLEGLRVPQVPRVQGSVALRHLGAGRGLDAMIVVRASSGQYDDDRNLFFLRSSLLVDSTVGSRIAEGVGWFAAVENLFDAEVDVARTPQRSVGLPRAVRAGVRVDWR